jgi:outer membrane usher protein FimD/PapC
MNVQSRGYVDPARWDDGIPAAFVNYNLTGSQTRQSDDSSRSSYLNLRSGVNLAPGACVTSRRWSMTGPGAGIHRAPGCSAT